jgi:hypothetical protein
MLFLLGVNNEVKGARERGKEAAEGCQASQGEALHRKLRLWQSIKPGIKICQRAGRTNSGGAGLRQKESQMAGCCQVGVSREEAGIEFVRWSLCQRTKSEAVPIQYYWTPCADLYWLPCIQNHFPRGLR